MGKGLVGSRAGTLGLRLWLGLLLHTASKNPRIQERIFNRGWPEAKLICSCLAEQPDGQTVKWNKKCSLEFGC